jgi:REP element-mobilizing transposase RayT
MSGPEREVVCKAIITLCLEGDWRLLAAHVRSNHVHIVVAADRDPGRIMSDIKARASRELTNAGFDSTQRKRWTRHGSTKYLFSDDEVAAAIRYTLDEQGERMEWYSAEPRTQ